MIYRTALARTWKLGTISTNPLATVARSYSSKRKGQPHPNSVPLEKAISILKAYEVGKPQQTVELHVHCNAAKGQPPIRGSCMLPRSYSTNIK
ncbi:hypothetical protein LPJ81_003257, partial [Coemansia sp. IMI 209127]